VLTDTPTWLFLVGQQEIGVSKRTITIVFLAAALLGTNAWWLYRSIDFGISHTYGMAECEEHAQALAQVKAILPVVAGPDSTREQILAAARLANWPEPFEKDGVVRVGRVGLKFSADGRLIALVD